MTALLLALGLAWGGLEVEPPPRAGAESVILVTDDEGEPVPGQTVRVVHAPGTHHEEELAAGITDGRGRVRWTPERSGVVLVRAEAWERRLAVAWPAPPPQTLILLALVALASLAALGYGLAPHRTAPR